MSQNDYTIREAYEADLPAVAELFRRHDYGPQEFDWLRWKYLENPDGPARMFVAEDSAGAIVGFQAFLPRRFMSARTGIFSVLHNVDVFVSAELRKAGIYSKLSKYCGKNLTNPRIAFPNSRSVSFGLRNGYQILAPIQAWIFPVAVGQLVRESPYFFLAPLMNALSRLYATFWMGRPRSIVGMRRLENFRNDVPMDPELIHGIRSAAYLNWRFISNPMFSYSVYEFFQGDDRIGYCAYATSGTTAEIFDFVTVRARRVCLRLLVEHCRDKGIGLLTFPGVGLKLRRFGFIRRGSLGACTTRDVPDGRWVVTLCDRDV